MFQKRYSDVFTGNETWNQIPTSGGELYEWDPESTYIQEPPFFLDLTAELPPIEEIHEARVLALLGDWHLLRIGHAETEPPAEPLLFAPG